MTKIIYTCVLTFTISFCLFSCKGDDSKKVESKSKEEITKQLIAEGYTEKPEYKDITDDMIKEYRDYAAEAIKHRRQKDNNKAWQILDVDMWEYEFEYKNQAISKPGEMAGNWIDFDQDLTYSRGYYDKVQETGQYHFNFDTKELLLLSDNEDIKPFEYKAKIVNAVMVLQGNSTYKDNAYQGKLKRIVERPTKG